MLHKVSIAGLTMDPASNTPIIILKSEEHDQAIPMDRVVGSHLHRIGTPGYKIRTSHDTRSL